MSQTQYDTLEINGEKLEVTEQEKLDFVSFLNQNKIQDFSIQDARKWLDQKRAGIDNPVITFEPEPANEIGLEIPANEPIAEPVTTTAIVPVPVTEPVLENPPAITEPEPDLTAAVNEAKQLLDPENIHPENFLTPDNDQAEKERRERWNPELVQPEPIEEDEDRSRREPEDEYEETDDETNDEEIKDQEARDIAHQLPKVDEEELADIAEESKEASEEFNEEVKEQARKAAEPNLKFECTFADLAEFQRITAAARTHFEELTFEVNESGINFRSMDPSHVGLIEVHIDYNSFRKFHCESPGKFTVRLEDFETFLKRGKVTAKNSDLLVLSKADQESLKINLVGKREKKFELHLIESSQSNTPLPKLIFSTKFSIAYKDFDEILGDVGSASSHLVMHGYDNQIIFSGKGDTGKIETALNTQNGLLYYSRFSADSKPVTRKRLDSSGNPVFETIDTGKPLYENNAIMRDPVTGKVVTEKIQREIEDHVYEPLEFNRASYSMDYILKLLKALKPEIVTAEYSTSMPVRFSFIIGNPGEGSFFHYYLAPRVEA